jgi:uncharacterized cupredoxin-like copper-binding protein
LAIAGVAAVMLSLAPFVAGCGSGDGNGDAVPTATRWADVTPVSTEPGGDPTTEQVVVEVDHGEWYVDTSQDTVPAGTVTFNVINSGLILHNFKVARTDLDPAALPVDSSVFMVDETQVDVLAASSDLPGGGTEQVIVDLPPGNYVLFCNLAGHYEAGVFTGFTVE